MISSLEIYVLNIPINGTSRKDIKLSEKNNIV